MSTPANVRTRLEVPRKYDLPRSLGSLRMGGRDPAFRAAGRALALCFRTPEGPVTIEAAHRPGVVELRTFGGLTREEIAEVLRVSVPTVGRRWRLARAWLYRRLAEGAG